MSNIHSDYHDHKRTGLPSSGGLARGGSYYDHSSYVNSGVGGLRRSGSIYSGTAYVQTASGGLARGGKSIKQNGYLIRASGGRGMGGSISSAGIVVAITSPANGATVWGTVPVSANATGGTTITHVLWSVDGTPWYDAFAPASPFAGSINSDQFSDGVHTLTATAYDVTGASTSASVSLTFANTSKPAGAVAIPGGTAMITLSVPNTYYYLTGDVTTQLAGVKVNADNCTLDLNVHTITWDQDTPCPQVTNPGFETGNFTGWDTSAAPISSIVPSVIGMYGNYMAQLGPATADQSILSSAITLPTAGIPYAVGAMMKSAFFPPCNISVVDAVTGVVYNSYTQPGATSGNGGFLWNAGSANTDPGGLNWVSNLFVPTTGQLNIKIKLTMRPNGATPVTAWFDYVSVSRSGLNTSGSTRVAGIYAGSGAINRFRLISSASGGSLVKGTADSWNAVTVGGGWFSFLENFQATGVAFNFGGWDSNGVGSSSPVMIFNNNTVTASMDRQSNRQSVVAACTARGADYRTHPSLPKGVRRHNNNTITGQLQCGIFLGEHGNTLNLECNYNTISQHSLWGDGYSIAANGLGNFEIAHNTLTPSSGRGILLQSGYAGADHIENGTVHENYVSIRELGNAGDGQGSTACALRQRNNLLGGAYLGIFNVHVYNNTFIATTGGHGEMQWCAAARFSNAIAHHQDNGGNIFENNICKGIVDGIDTPFLGTGGGNGQDGFGIQLLEYGDTIGPWFKYIGNTYESNDCSVCLGASDGINVYNGLLVGSMMVKSTLGLQTPFFSNLSQATRSYEMLMSRYLGGFCSNILLVDQAYSGGASQTMDFGGNLTKQISFGYMLDLTVQDGSGTPQIGANVTVRTTGGTTVFTGTTNAAGKVVLNPFTGTTGIPLGSTTYTSNGTSGQNTTPVSTNNNPFSVSAVSGILTGTSSVTLTTDQSLTLTVV